MKVRVTICKEDGQVLEMVKVARLLSVSVRSSPPRALYWQSGDQQCVLGLAVLKRHEHAAAHPWPAATR